MRSTAQTQDQGGCCLRVGGPSLTAAVKAERPAASSAGAPFSAGVLAWAWAKDPGGPHAHPPFCLPSLQWLVAGEWVSRNRQAAEKTGRRRNLITHLQLRSPRANKSRTSCCFLLPPCASPSVVRSQLQPRLGSNRSPQTGSPGVHTPSKPDPTACPAQGGIRGGSEGGRPHLPGNPPGCWLTIQFRRRGLHLLG